MVGSLGYDDVETPSERRRGVLGGAAAYFALAASLYGRVRLVSVVGDDFRSADVERLRQRGADVSGIERRAGRSLRWYGRYGHDMSTQETLNVDLGVSRDWRPRLPEAARDAHFVFIANLHPDVQLEIQDQLRGPRLVAIDSMHEWIERQPSGLAKTMARADVVSLNEAEVRQFATTARPSGEAARTSGAEVASVEHAARRILALGPIAVVVKRGAQGAVLFTRDESSFSSPAYPVDEVRDPTGAGDAFAGGLVGYLAGAGRSGPDELGRAVLHGTVCASFALETFSVDGIEAATAEAVADRYQMLSSLVATGAGASAEPSPMPRG